MSRIHPQLLVCTVADLLRPHSEQRHDAVPEQQRKGHQNALFRVFRVVCVHVVEVLDNLSK